MYLGVLINDGCQEECEIQWRLGKKCAGGLNNFMKSRNISRRSKLRLFKDKIIRDNQSTAITMARPRKDGKS